jgi:5'(3')-deoxyribonucleotidase
MMGKLRLLIDIDGVCRDIIPKMAEIYQRETGKEAKLPITTWGMKRNFPKIDDVATFFFKQRDNAREIFEENPVIEGAEVVLKRLAESFDIILVSHQYRGNERFTRNWLLRNGLYFPVIYTDRKFLVPGDILIDDRIENLEEFEKTERRAICFANPWNEEYKGVRIENWYEIEDYLHHILDELNNFGESDLDENETASGDGEVSEVG